MDHYKIGLAYTNGEGMEENLIQGFYWIEKAALKGHDLSQLTLSDIYHAGLGVDQDADKALRWLREAADQGSPHGAIRLAYSYRYGVLTKKDLDQARAWFERGASIDNPLGSFDFASFLQQEYPDETDLALTHFTIAANAGHIDAQFQLGEIFRLGIGVEPNPQEALNWYQVANSAGSTKAAKYLHLANPE